MVSFFIYVRSLLDRFRFVDTLKTKGYADTSPETGSLSFHIRVKKTNPKNIFKELFTGKARSKLRNIAVIHLSENYEPGINLTESKVLNLFRWHAMLDSRRCILRFRLDILNESPSYIKRGVEYLLDHIAKIRFRYIHKSDDLGYAINPIIVYRIIKDVDDVILWFSTRLIIMESQW